MSVSGLCYICGNPGSHTCESCGGTVCDEHYDASTGFCVKCLGGRRMED
ncbi:MAG: hypothetical protein ACOCRA_03990 [Halobacteria archaeon]